MALKFAFAAVKLIGRGSWFCEDCMKNPKVSDPIKNNSTPHCLACGMHHAVHVDCNGKSIVPPPIDYMQLFYTNRNTTPLGIAQEIGIA